MQAYLVHDSRKQKDMMVLPETDRLVPVDRKVMENFIAVKPDFDQWSGAPLNGLAPATFGRVFASRQVQEDVCIIDEALWHQRMTFHLGSP
ncbi:MAG: hypothetical protein KFF50_09810 [Desulfatitalea sp.]|nr:hypothetical protein [Desulfatitalea sp.]